MKLNRGMIIFLGAAGISWRRSSWLRRGRTRPTPTWRRPPGFPARSREPRRRSSSRRTSGPSTSRRTRASSGAGDPFSLPVVINPDSTSLILDERLQVLPQLTGISILGADRRAIVDGQIVGVGDRLASGFVVLQVSEDAVVLEKEDRRIDLNFDSRSHETDLSLLDSRSL